MKRLLLICYYFPPLGLGGVGRPLNLFKKLPDYGYQCDILTVKPVLYRAYEPELLNGLDRARIYRAGSRDPQRLLYMLGMRKVKGGTIDRGRKVSGRFFPDSKVGWVRPALRYGRRLCRRNGYDLLMSTSPPMSSHLIGLDLSAATGIPLVADFRDFWTSFKVEDVFDNPEMIRRGEALLKRIASSAAAVTCANGSIVDYLGAGETITNGYDSDFAVHWKLPPDRERFTIGLLGHQHETTVLEPLLNLLEGLCGKLGAKPPIRLLQVGQVDRDRFAGPFRDRGLDIELDLRGLQPREETIRILSGAHVFYIGMSEEQGLRSLPGRLFELVASGRPVVAAAEPDGETARLLHPTGNSICFSNADPDGAVARLAEVAAAFQRGEYHCKPLSDYARQFSSDEMARRFAAVMDGVS